MADLRGFTALAERLAPQQMVTLINNYLDVMTGILLRHQGTIDEFIGDAILAIFGAPQCRPDDAERAVACAVEMQLAMAKVNARNRAAGLPDVEMGIGLNTGEVAVGNIGSTIRAKYGVVGSAVNHTARIEAYTTGGQVLISQATLEEAGDSVVIDQRMEVSPKGVCHPIPIHRVSGIRGRYELHLSSAPAAPTAPAFDLGARFAVLDGKDAGGEPRYGSVVRLSREIAEIASTHSAPALANVKLQFAALDGSKFAGDVYAKVTGPGSQVGTFVVRFTSVSPEAAVMLSSAIER
jgi:adenylate cyclase